MKVTGAVLFVFPLSLVFAESEAFVTLICVVASISAIEELLIHLSSKELQINKKSILR